MEELLSLKWNNHRSTFLHILTVLRDKQQYSDATLACEGRFYSVHKLVLSTCSDYFSAMFDRTTACKNPIIVLKDIKCDDLESLLDYMYLGEVNVRQADLASLIKAAECLRVKGLAVPDDEPPKKGSHSDSSVKRHSKTNSPPAKRKRRSEDHDGRPSSSQKLMSPNDSRLSPLPQDSLPDSGEPVSPSQQHSTSGLREDSSITESPFIKVEMDDTTVGDLGDSYIPNDGYKEEADHDPGDLSNDLPEFLQQDSVSHSQGSSSFTHGSFPGTSSFQPGDLSGWQGEGSNSNFPSHMNFGSSDTSQNASGELTLLPELLTFTMEAAIRELFAKRLYERYELSKKYLIPKSDYTKIIDDLKYAHLVKSTKSRQHYYLIRKYEIFSDVGEEKLIRKRKSPDEVPIFYVSIEDTYDIIKQAHLATKHGGRDRMAKCLSKVYANIPTWAVEIFKSYCIVCQRRKNFFAGISAIAN